MYVPDQPDFALDLGVTLSAWAKPQALDRVRTRFRKRDDGKSSLALFINGKKLQFVVRFASGRLVSVAAPPKAGSWTHVAATYDKTWVRLYLDGTEVSCAHAPGVIARGVGPLLMVTMHRAGASKACVVQHHGCARSDHDTKLPCVRLDPMSACCPRDLCGDQGRPDIHLSVNNPTQPRCDSGSVLCQ